MLIDDDDIPPSHPLYRIVCYTRDYYVPDPPIPGRTSTAVWSSADSLASWLAALNLGVDPQDLLEDGLLCGPKLNGYLDLIRNNSGHWTAYLNAEVYLLENIVHVN